MTAPQATYFGIDDNNKAAIGGFSDSLAPITAKMIPDAGNPTLGALEVAVTGGAGPTAKNLEGGRIALLAATATQLSAAVGAVSSIAIRNHDGGSPNGNADNLYVGLSASVSNTDFIMVLTPGEGFVFAVDDPTKLWLYAVGAITICTVYAG
jgi:hypothetical protein